MALSCVGNNILVKLSRKVFIRNIRMSAIQLKVEKVVEELKDKNPYYEKYANKIAALQQTSPEEFLERVEKFKEKKAPKKESQRNYSELLNPKTIKPTPCDELPHKKLSDIMKVELIQDKSAEDIKQIWFEYHKQRDVIAAVMSTEQFEKLMKRSKEHPIFLLPLPRSEGYEFILLQFSANSVHFTPLLCYQVHKENAPECLTITHYTETEDKGLVLMRGEYDTKVLNAQEAQCLANQLQLYYCKDDESKLNLLSKFTKNPDAFKHMELITELENIKIQ